MSDTAETWTITFSQTLLRSLFERRQARGADAPVIADPIPADHVMTVSSQAPGTISARLNLQDAIYAAERQHNSELAEKQRQMDDYKAAVRAQIVASNSIVPEITPEAQTKIETLNAKLTGLESKFHLPEVAFGSVCGDIRVRLTQCLTNNPNDSLVCSSLTRAFAKCSSENAL